jgi:glycosyltransferase involved in cell wall biosynthesis
MNILFLCHRIPFPPNKGDKIRSYNELKYLSKRHDIYLATTLDAISDKEYIDGLIPYCKEICAVHFNRNVGMVRRLLTLPSFSVASFYSRQLQQYVDSVLTEKNIDTILCFCSSMAEYVFRSRAFRSRKSSDFKLVLDFVDLDSDKWAQYAKYSKMPLSMIFSIENKRLFNYEIKINNTFDYSIFVSEREKRIFKNLYPSMQNVHVIPNGVDAYYFFPKKEVDACLPTTCDAGDRVSAGIKTSRQFDSSPYRKDVRNILFTGIMSYLANEDGVKWFCNQILPLIWGKIPDVEFYIVGNHPSRIVRKLGTREGVTVTGFVEDIRPYYWHADVCVIPLRIARGLQNKVLEAMATGNAVVATSNASDGIICQNKQNILIADTETNFAARVIELLNDDKRRLKMGANAVLNILEHYSWNRNFSAFDEILHDA